MIDSGLYTMSKSPSASRPHIVRKPLPTPPRTLTYDSVVSGYVATTGCLTTNCRSPSLRRPTAPKNYPNKLPSYSLYWGTDRFSMYNAYELAMGPSRELLAVHTPLGLLEPTRIVFGEMNAGTVACAATPAIIRTLPDSAYLRTAAYVDDHTQGSHTFADLLKGYTDFLALCERENWTLNATKTPVPFMWWTSTAPASLIRTWTPSSAWSPPPTYLSCA
jgi:hypothetical protein